MAVKETRKRSGLVIYSCLKDTAFTAAKKDEKYETRYVKWMLFVSRWNTKGRLIFHQKYYVKGKGV